MRAGSVISFEQAPDIKQRHSNLVQRRKKNNFIKRSIDKSDNEHNSKNAETGADSSRSGTGKILLDNSINCLYHFYEVSCVMSSVVLICILVVRFFQI